MNTNELTIGQAREIAAMFNQQNTNLNLASSDHPWEIGAVYLIRTVTMIDLGRVVRVTHQEIVLEDAAWIADTGRFADALTKCEFNEIEPFPDGKVIVGRAAVIDSVKVATTKRSQK